MQRRVVSFMLAVLLVLCFSVPSFAFPVPVATSGNAMSVATPGNAVMSPGIQDAIDEIQPYADMPGDIGGATVGMAGIAVYFKYYAFDGSVKQLVTHLRSDGYFSFAKPSDFDMLFEIEFAFEKVLPPPGKYNVRVGFASNTGGMNYKEMRVWSNKQYNNANGLSNDSYCSVSQNSGDYTASVSMDIGSPSYFRFCVRASNLIPPYGGYLSLQFNRLQSNAEVDGSTAGGPTTPEEQTSSAIASLGDMISDLISGIVSAIVNIGSQISGAVNNASSDITNNANSNSQNEINAAQENASDIMANADRNTQEQISAADKNADDIMNSYDNSEMNSGNEQLSGSLDELQAQEDQLMDQISEPLSDFEFDNPVTQYLSTFIWFGDFLQDLFDQSGGFKNVINLSFLMTIALMVIGLYRFKGGN